MKNLLKPYEIIRTINNQPINPSYIQQSSQIPFVYWVIMIHLFSYFVQTPLHPCRAMLKIAEYMTGFSIQILILINLINLWVMTSAMLLFLSLLLYQFLSLLLLLLLCHNIHTAAALFFLRPRRVCSRGHSTLAKFLLVFCRKLSLIYFCS